MQNLPYYMLILDDEKKKEVLWKHKFFIAQSFKKKAFIIFGATHPKYIHMPENTVPIYDKNRHKLCKHSTRQEEIDCCEEFCMERIAVSEVFNQIKANT